MFHLKFLVKWSVRWITRFFEASFSSFSFSPWTYDSTDEIQWPVCLIYIHHPSELMQRDTRRFSTESCSLHFSKTWKVDNALIWLLWRRDIGPETAAISGVYTTGEKITPHVARIDRFAGLMVWDLFDIWRMEYGHICLKCGRWLGKREGRSRL